MQKEKEFLVFVFVQPFEGKTAGFTAYALADTASMMVIIYLNYHETRLMKKLLRK